MSENFEMIHDTFILWPRRRDSRVHQLDNLIWALQGCHMLQQQPSFIQNIVIQPKFGLLCISLESLVRFYEKEKQKKNEVIPPRLFAFLSQIHVVIILQRQVLACAITTQWEEGVTIMQCWQIRAWTWNTWDVLHEYSDGLFTTLLLNRRWVRRQWTNRVAHICIDVCLNVVISSRGCGFNEPHRAVNHLIALCPPHREWVTRGGCLPVFHL